TCIPFPTTSTKRSGTRDISLRRSLIADVENENRLADKALIPGGLLKAKANVIKFDAHGAVLGSGEALAVAEPVLLDEAGCARAREHKLGRVNLASWTTRRGGRDDIIASHMGGDPRLWQRDIANERGHSVDRAAACGMRYAEVERADILTRVGELGEEVVKCDHHGLVIGAENRADGGRVAPSASGNDLTGKRDLGKCGGGQHKGGDSEELHLEGWSWLHKINKVARL
ncbi:hypothetical protein QBC41DRAFT_228922, partial [Cercophora samala]